MSKLPQGERIRTYLSALHDVALTRPPLKKQAKTAMLPSLMDFPMFLRSGYVDVKGEIWLSDCTL